MSARGSVSTPNRTRRKKTDYSPGLSTSLNVLQDNDDVEEKRRRRKSKLLSNNLLSPGGVQASPARSSAGEQEKRKSVNLSHVGMSNAQLKEHYASCIKLSSENKINSKNAFGLHLIDYMKELLKQNNKEETGATNFQVASCTLDAGVKIYAYRVDSVHSEAYKVLGSLGRTKDIENEPEQGELESGDDRPQSQVIKKTKKKNSGKTIETNMKNILLEQLDLDFELDPFFYKIAATFDEGGTSGLLSLQINKESDENNLLMESTANINNVFISTTSESTEDSTMVDLSMIRDMYGKVSMDEMEICEQFSEFQFSGWDKNSQGVGDSMIDSYRFDENAPVVPEPMESFSEMGGNGDYDSSSDGDNDGIGPITYDGRPAEMMPEDIVSRTSISNGTGSTCLALSLQPSEYSYFSQDILSTWAGPLHWKVKPKSEDRNMSSKDTSTKTVIKRGTFRMTLDEKIDALQKKFTSGKAFTHLKETTLEKYAPQMTKLPPDLHYNVESLCKFFIRDIVITRQQDAKEIQDKGEEWYNYDNKNDREGFCPVVDDGGHDYDDDDDNDDRTCDFTQPDNQQLSILSGDNLLTVPNKVRVPNIDYAKSAKRIDIKKLKSAMWKMISTKKPDDKENNENENNNLPKPALETGDKDSGDQISGTYSFKSMYDTLPDKVSSNMAKNLSGPIAFVCLLYLANEKCLKLTGKEDMSDVLIENGT